MNYKRKKAYFQCLAMRFNLTFFAANEIFILTDVILACQAKIKSQVLLTSAFLSEVATLKSIGTYKL